MEPNFGLKARRQMASIVLRGPRLFAVQGDHATYDVRLDADGPTCPCPARAACTHEQAVKWLLERTSHFLAAYPAAETQNDDMSITQQSPSNLAQPAAPSALAQRLGLDQGKLELIRTQIAPGAPDDVIELFMHRCKVIGCDPLGKMMYVINRKRRENKNGTWTESDNWTFQASIDLFRSQAESSGQYAGQLGPFWCGEDGVWKDVWLSQKSPSAAKVGIIRKDFSEPVFATATWASYVQTDREGKPTGLWARMGDVMIAKCAEGLAFRKAFPAKLNGIYSEDEMQQADSQRTALRDVTPESRPALPATNTASDSGRPPSPKAPWKSWEQYDAVIALKRDMMRLNIAGDGAREWIRLELGMPEDLQEGLHELDFDQANKLRAAIAEEIRALDKAAELKPDPAEAA